MSLAGARYDLSDDEPSDGVHSEDEAEKQQQVSTEKETTEGNGVRTDSDAIAESVYDDVDQFDFDGSEIGEIGFVTKSKIIQAAVEGFITFR